MNRTLDQLRLMFGGEPKKAAPEDFTPGAKHLHATKKLTKADFVRMMEGTRVTPEKPGSPPPDAFSNATARDAVRAAGLDQPCAALGRFGKPIEPGTALRDGDRVELLRPLYADPKEARRRRARRR